MRWARQIHMNFIVQVRLLWHEGWSGFQRNIVQAKTKQTNACPSLLDYM